MGPSVAGRGKPRPLLDGVFRKACDYCVRSKRGCNGGTPCEQCIRRGQGCTYSQRRKSGPRGRPLRPPQQVISAPSPAIIGTRTSARRTTKSMSSPDKASSPSPSPSRTASMSCSSSDFSEGGDDEEAFSDDSSDTEEVEQQQQQRQQKQTPTLHAHKRSKISREETAVVPAGHQQGSSSSPPPAASNSGGGDQQPHPVSPSPFVAKQTGPKLAGSRTRGGAAAAAAAAARTTAEEDAKQQDSTVEPSPASSSSFFDEPASYLAKNRISGSKAAPPRQHSPLTVGAPPLTLQLQRSSSLPTWARETSTDAEQRRQQVHRSSASVGAVPTYSSSSSSSSRGEAIHEITMQPWGNARPRPVTLVNMAQQQQQQQQQQEARAHQAPAFAVASARIFATRHSAQQSLPPADPMDDASSIKQTAAAPTATLAASMIMGGGNGDDGEFVGAGAALKDLDEEDDFAHCPWRIPSLTREQSLARVVAALGAEQGASSQQGVGGGGFEGGGVTAW